MKEARSVVISGASRGLGAALARRFAAPGMRLLLLARSAAALEGVAQECRAAGALAEAVVLDVTDAAAVAAALAAFEAAGPVDLVIANAGTSAGRAPDGTPEDGAAAARQVMVNLVGAINLVAPLLPGMRARRSGQVALVASIAGFRGLPDFPAYCASKAGLSRLGEGWRAERGRGICVTVITRASSAARWGTASMARAPAAGDGGSGGQGASRPAGRRAAPRLSLAHGAGDAAAGPAAALDRRPRGGPDALPGQPGGSAAPGTVTGGRKAPTRSSCSARVAAATATARPSFP